MAKTIRHFDVTGSSESSLFCAQFSRDDEFIATSDMYGTIRITNTKTGTLSPFSLKPNSSLNDLPIVSFQWRPENENVLHKKVITAVRTDGYIQQFHAVNGKSLSLTDAYENKRDNISSNSSTSSSDYSSSYMPGLLCMDYKSDGSQFACSGKDPEIFIFDEMTKKKIITFPRNDSPSELTGHSSRVCACKYLSQGQGDSGSQSRGILVTGAWDNTLQFWDDRRGNRSVGTIVGPQVSSSLAIDVHDNRLLVGSFRGTDQLQIYDLRTRTLMQDLSKVGMSSSESSSIIDRNSFSESIDSSYAGGSGIVANSGDYLFNNDSNNNYNSIFPLIPSGLHVYSAQFSCNGKYIAVGGNNSDGSKGFMRVLNTLDFTWEGTGCKCAVFGHRNENLLCAIGTEGKITVMEI